MRAIKRQARERIQRAARTTEETRAQMRRTMASLSVDTGHINALGVYLDNGEVRIALLAAIDELHACLGTIRTASLEWPAEADYDRAGY